MADERNMRNDGADALSVRVTVIAVRRVAAMAERALREAGYTEDDALLQDVLAARLIAEDSLAMEEAGDPLAEPMAREALSIAKEALKAAHGGEAPQEDSDALRVAEDEATPASAPVVILSGANAVSAVEGSPAAAAEAVPAAEPPAIEPSAATPSADAERDPSTAALRASAQDDNRPARDAADAPEAPAPASAPDGPLSAVDAARPRHAAAPRPARIELPEVLAAPAIAPAPQPEPVAAPEPAPAPGPQPAPVRVPEPSAPRPRSGRGFAIPYGPAADTAEDAFFAPAPEPASPEPPEPAGAAPDSTAPAGPARRPRAARRVCAALAAVLAVLVGLVGAAWWGFFDLPEPVQARIELLPDAHATQGRLNAAETDVAPGSYQLVLNQVATMDAGSRTLPIAFENPMANAYSSRLVLSVDGERVASTGMVAPGFYVESVELARTLPQGEHELSAAVHVYSGATQVNTMSANVTVRVR